MKKLGVFKTLNPKVGEGDLSEDEKKKIVTELVQNKPAVFLQRFGRFLRCLIISIMIVNLDHEDGQLFRVMEWLMFFFSCPGKLNR